MCDSSRGSVPQDIWNKIHQMSMDKIIKKYGDELSSKQLKHIQTFKNCISASADVKVKRGLNLAKQSGTLKNTCTKKFLGPCPTSPQECHSNYKRGSGMHRLCIDAYCKHATKDERKPKSARKKCNKALSYTSEPIPDYIMRALQPKNSVHPEYGKLRY